MPSLERPGALPTVLSLERTHRRRRHHHRRHRLKTRERNFLAAIGSMIVIVTLSSALAGPHWFKLHGGGCKKDGKVIDYIGVNDFFYMFGLFRSGSVVTDKGQTDGQLNTYYYGTGYSHNLVDCVTSEIVRIMKSIIALCFVGILCSLFAFTLDMFGPNNRWLKFIRRHGIMNIMTVLICVTVNGFCYWNTQLIEKLQKTTKVNPGSKVAVTFDVSFYLIAGAGGMSVVTVACNLLCIRWYITNGRRRNRTRDVRLLDDYDGQDFVPPGPEVSAAVLNNLPPPPEYEP